MLVNVIFTFYILFMNTRILVFLLYFLDAQNKNGKNESTLIIDSWSELIDFAMYLKLTVSARMFWFSYTHEYMTHVGRSSRLLP